MQAWVPLWLLSIVGTDKKCGHEYLWRMWSEKRIGVWGFIVFRLEGVDQVAGDWHQKRSSMPVLMVFPAGISTSSVSWKDLVKQRWQERIDAVAESLKTKFCWIFLKTEARSTIFAADFGFSGTPQCFAEKAVRGSLVCSAKTCDVPPQKTIKESRWLAIYCRLGGALWCLDISWRGSNDARHRALISSSGLHGNRAVKLSTADGDIGDDIDVAVANRNSENPYAEGNGDRENRIWMIPISTIKAKKKWHSRWRLIGSGMPLQLSTISLPYWHSLLPPGCWFRRWRYGCRHPLLEAGPS